MYEFFYLFERSELLLFHLYHREGKGDKKKKPKLNDFSF